MTDAHRLHQIVSLDAPELEPYRTLRRPHDHLARGIFVAEGAKVVKRFLASEWGIVSMLMTQEWYDEIIPAVPPTRIEGVDVFVGSKRLLETIVGFGMHQGIMAVGKVPPIQSLQPALASPHFLVALDGLVHAENVGVVVRNCAALGVGGLLVSNTTASPYLRRAVRNSMGGIFKLSCLHTHQLATDLAALHATHGTRIIIADAHAPGTIHEMDFGGNICIVLGNENSGVSDAVEAVATDRVRIPMTKEMDSLNVASASAIMLYEAHRARN